MNSYYQKTEQHYLEMDYLSFMKKSLENILKKEIEIGKLLIILVILLGIGWGIFYYTRDYVIVRFDELGPITKNMVAYYNGFKIGKIVKIKPDSDFKHTLVRVNLNQQDINLPQNTTAHVERFPSGELYLQFVYPSSPTFKTIQRGDILEGISPSNVEQFMLGQNISGVTDVVSQHVIKTLDATEMANIEIKIFFQNSSKLVNENSAGINKSVNNTEVMTRNLAQMAENLNQTSKKLNNALDETLLKESITNVKDTTSNVKDATENISKASKDIDKTIKKIDATISQAHSTAQNLNSISNGLNDTFSKKFAGMRLMFGTPVKQKNYARNSCK